MIQVLKQEFFDTFKSIRSILIIVFMTFVSYQSATFMQRNPGLMEEALAENGDNVSLYSAVIAFLVLLFGFLFVFATSHNVINKEIEKGTMRLLVTKISRTQIVTGKMLGTMLFWTLTISITFAILSVITGTWLPIDYIQSLVCLFYMISFTLLLSTIVPKSTLTMFLGVFLGISLPIVGLVATLSDKWYIIPFKYGLPYYYLDDSILLLFVPFGIGVIYFLTSVYILKRKDL